MLQKGRCVAMQTSGVSTRSLEPDSKSALGGTAASESVDSITTKSDGEGNSAGEVVSLDVKMEGIEAVGGERSESSRDLESGR